MLIKILFLLFPSLYKQVLDLINSAIELERYSCAELARNARTQWTPFGDVTSVHGSIIAAKIETRKDKWELPKEEPVVYKSSFNEVLQGMTL